MGPRFYWRARHSRTTGGKVQRMEDPVKWGEKFSGLGGGAGGMVGGYKFSVRRRGSRSCFVFSVQCNVVHLCIRTVASNLQGVRNTPGEREKDTPSPPCATIPVPVVEGGSEFEGNARRFERQFLGSLGRW